MLGKHLSIGHVSVAGEQIFERKWHFLSLVVLVFLALFAMLAALDLLPESLQAATSKAQALAPIAETVPAAATSTLPVRIVIPEVGIDANIENPTTTNIRVLDDLLLQGAVRYPTSAVLGEKGNMILFGHSTYLPLTTNGAYRTFDGIAKLLRGDTITVYSSSRVYTYKVESVSKESATDAGIPLNVSGRVLTLSTCDSFGKKTDRFVAVATFVESHPIPTAS